MLRINLLPPYIFDKQKKVQVGLVWLAAVIVVIFLFISWASSVNKQLADATALRDQAKTYQDQYTALDGNIKKVQGDIKNTQDKQTFVASAETYNKAWPAVYTMMRDVTDDKVLLKRMAVDPATHQTISFAGFAPSEMEVVRWWMALRNNPDKFDHISFALPSHGYPQGAVNTGGAGRMMMASATGGQNSEVGIGEIEGRVGLNFTGAVTLKKPIADGMSLPAWPPGSGGANSGRGGFGGAMGGPMGGPPGGFGGPGGGPGGKRFPSAPSVGGGGFGGSGAAPKGGSGTAGAGVE